MLRVQAPGVEGAVGFAGHRVTYAKALGLSGMDALTLLTGLRQGRFTYANELPPASNLKGTLAAVLTDLAAAADEWRKLTHLPEDWSQTLRQATEQPGLGLTLSERSVLLDAEGKTVAEVLAVPGEVLSRAQVLDRLLAKRILVPLPSEGVGPVVLVALPYYGPQSQVAYVDRALYERWVERIRGAFKLRVRSPRGIEASYRVEPRERIPERIMLHDRELRKLRAGRGTRLKVMPEV